MRVPVWVKPGVWGSVVGAIAISILGFNQMGWTTGGTADRMATERANAAVVAAFVPFCVAKAQQDTDKAKLVKLGGETSSYSRRQIVMDAGWATMLGMPSPVSVTATSTVPSAIVPSMRIPCALAYFAAFSTRLVRTCSSLSGSASTSGKPSANVMMQSRSG